MPTVVTGRVISDPPGLDLTIYNDSSIITGVTQNTTVFGTGDNVELTFTGYAGYTFSNWEGDVPSGHETDNPLTISVGSSPITITAKVIIPDA